MNINSITQQPYLITSKKLKKLPEIILYNTRKHNIYNMLDVKTNKIVGTISVDIRDMDTDDFYQNIKRPYKSYHICELEVFDKLKGFGKKLIDFAKKESFRNNCEGRITLVAYNEDKAPHVFYRKQGFTTNNPQMNNKLDDAIKNYDTIEKMKLAYMYLMPEKISKNIK